MSIQRSLHPLVTEQPSGAPSPSLGTLLIARVIDQLGETPTQPTPPKGWLTNVMRPTHPIPLGTHPTPGGVIDQHNETLTHPFPSKGVTA